MQTILGSGGAIGTELAKALSNYTNSIRLVSRNPKKVNSGDTLFPADLTDPLQLNKAVEGSSICYLTIGYEYSTKVWKKKWPELIRNLVDACIQHNSKLVFFDNVYAIGGDGVKHITEDSPMNPASKKGEIRAYVDNYILEQVKAGKLKAIIARSPEFFGPIKDNSMVMIMVYDNLLKRKAAQWLCNSRAKHSMGYAPELAKGTALLGNTAEAYNQIWNLPVDDKALTGLEWVKLFADEMHTTNKIQVLPSWALKLLGFFIPILGEMYEMCYQFDRDYYFDSSKFRKQFNYSPISNEEAVGQTISMLKK